MRSSRSNENDSTKQPARAEGKLLQFPLRAVSAGASSRDLAVSELLAQGYFLQAEVPFGNVDHWNGAALQSALGAILTGLAVRPTGSGPRLVPDVGGLINRPDPIHSAAKMFLELVSSAPESALPFVARALASPDTKIQDIGIEAAIECPASGNRRRTEITIPLRVISEGLLETPDSRSLFRLNKIATGLVLQGFSGSELLKLMERAFGALELQGTPKDRAREEKALRLAQIALADTIAKASYQDLSFNLQLVRQFLGSDQSGRIRAGLLVARRLLSDAAVDPFSVESDERSALSTLRPQLESLLDHPEDSIRALAASAVGTLYPLSTKTLRTLRRMAVDTTQERSAEERVAALAAYFDTSTDENACKVATTLIQQVDRCQKGIMKPGDSVIQTLIEIFRVVSAHVSYSPLADSLVRHALCEDRRKDIAAAACMTLPTVLNPELRQDYIELARKNRNVLVRQALVDAFGEHHDHSVLQHLQEFEREPLLIDRIGSYLERARVVAHNFQD